MKNWFKLGFLIKKKLSAKKVKVFFVATYHPILQALNDIIEQEWSQKFIFTWIHGVISRCSETK